MIKINLKMMTEEDCVPIPNSGQWAPTPPIEYENVTYVLNWSWEDFKLEVLEDDLYIDTGLKLDAN